MEEICVGPLPGTTDTTTKLMQLPQPEKIGAIDHERVDGGHVDARLDDRRAHQHVVPTVPEVDNDPLE